jgi:hypothetical protein
VSELGALLELLHDAVPPRTFEAEFRDWTRSSASDQLVVSAESRRVGPQFRWIGTGPFPRASSSSRRIWFARPDRIRVELARGTQLERLGVRDGDTWWRWDSSGGARTGRVTQTRGLVGLPPLLDPPLLSPARLIAGLRLQPTGRGVRAGREVVLAHADPRDQPVGRRPVSFELEFDAEHGSVLRREGFEDGCCVQITEALAVSYDAPIMSERFVFVAPGWDRAQQG